MRMLPRPFRRHVERTPRSRQFARWPRRWPARWFRQVFMVCCLLPILRLAYRIEVQGAERFEKAALPCLIISNHNMHLDWAVLFAAMPGGFRRKLMVAAASTDIFGNPVRRFGVQVLGNAFPFDKEGSGVRESLEFVTRMLGDGWNVLLFPEGKLTVAGPMAPFKQGIGWLVSRSGAEVLPIRIDIVRPGAYEGKWWPHPRGRVRVSIGEPVLPEGDDYRSVVAELERSVVEA